MRIDPSFQYLGNAADGVGKPPGQTKVLASETAAGDSSATDAGDTVQLSGTLSKCSS